MNFGKGVLVRCTAIVLLICICATAVLYVEGVFEFSFIDRQPVNENIKPPVTTAPIVTTVGSTPLPSAGTSDPPTSYSLFSHSTAARQCCFVYRYCNLIDTHGVLCQTVRDL